MEKYKKSPGDKWSCQYCVLGWNIKDNRFNIFKGIIINHVIFCNNYWSGRHIYLLVIDDEEIFRIFLSESPDYLIRNSFRNYVSLGHFITTKGFVSLIYMLVTNYKGHQLFINYLLSTRSKRSWEMPSAIFNITSNHE